MKNSYLFEKDPKRCAPKGSKNSKKITNIKYWDRENGTVTLSYKSKLLNILNYFDIIILAVKKPLDLCFFQFCEKKMQAGFRILTLG